MTSYTHPLTSEQAANLRALLKDLGFEFAERPYTIFFAQKNKLSVAVYEKGPKILLQGKGIEEFVQFELEPKILEEARLGYEEVHSPEMFEPHFGIDESGKGDFFGPLVIAGVYVDREIARKFLEAGIQDSKRIGSDKRIRELAKIIRTTPGAVGDTVSIGPERYNDLYEKFGNLNSLLGWGHARVIENLLGRKPDCPRALSDKFADASVIEKALLKHGQTIRLEQRTKAESGGGGGFDPRAGRVYRLARTPRKGAGGKTRPGRLRGGEGSGEESGGSRRAGGVAQSRKIAFPDGARGSTGAFSGAAAPQGVAIGPVRPIRPILRASFLLSFYR